MHGGGRGRCVWSMGNVRGMLNDGFPLVSPPPPNPNNSMVTPLVLLTSGGRPSGGRRTSSYQDQDGGPQVPAPPKWESPPSSLCFSYPCLLCLPRALSSFLQPTPGWPRLFSPPPLIPLPHPLPQSHSLTPAPTPAQTDRIRR